jgi:beta-glucosidase/6-phospho-beta-glucosidase/beta-galactosidase
VRSNILTILIKVKQWITLNEPWVTSVQGHGLGDHAPGIQSPGIMDYVAAHNQIRAHAKAYRLYHRDFAESQKGKPCMHVKLRRV